MVGEAEAIWTGLGEGRSCIVREGEAPATAQGAEQLVFRVSLLAAPSEAADSDDADVALSFLHVSDRAVSSCLSTALVGDGPSALLVDAKTFPRIDGAACSRGLSLEATLRCLHLRGRLPSFRANPSSPPSRQWQCHPPMQGSQANTCPTTPWSSFAMCWLSTRTRSLSPSGSVRAILLARRRPRRRRRGEQRRGGEEGSS